METFAKLLRGSTKADNNVGSPFHSTTLDVPSERILKHALDAGIEDVVVIGIAPDGGEWFESASANARTVLWLLERTEQLVLATVKVPPANPRTDKAT